MLRKKLVIFHQICPVNGFWFIGYRLSGKNILTQNDDVHVSEKASRFIIWQKDHSDNEIGGIQRE